MDPKETTNTATIAYANMPPDLAGNVSSSQLIVYFRDPTFDLVFSLLNGAIVSYYVITSKRPASVAINVAGYTLFLAIVTYILFDLYNFWIGRPVYSLVMVAVASFAIRYLSSKLLKKEA